MRHIGERIDDLEKAFEELERKSGDFSKRLLALESCPTVAPPIPVDKNPVDVEPVAIEDKPKEIDPEEVPTVPVEDKKPTEESNATS